MVGKLVKRMVLALLVLLAVGACVVGVRGWLMYRDALEEHPIAQTVDDLHKEPNYTTLEDLPQTYLDAVVAVEDHRFYEHAGIDPIAIVRAAVNDLRTLSLAEGGSTITQQLAKNLFFTQEKHLSRKAAEVFMAFDLERAYSKREILELYVNSAYFGRGCTGIGQASQVMLGKPASQMTPEECALMAGIPNAPSVYAADSALAAERRDIVIGQMRKYGYATDGL